MQSLKESSISSISFSVCSWKGSRLLRWCSLPMVLRSGLPRLMSKLSMIFSSFLRWERSQVSCAFSCLISLSIQKRLSFILSSFLECLPNSFSWQQFFSFNYLIFKWHCSSLEASLDDSPSPEEILRVSLSFSSPIPFPILPCCCSGASLSSSRQLLRLSRKEPSLRRASFLKEVAMMLLGWLVLALRERGLRGMVLFLGVATSCRQLQATCFARLSVYRSSRALSAFSLGFSLLPVSISISAQDFFRAWTSVGVC